MSRDTNFHNTVVAYLKQNKYLLSEINENIIGGGTGPSENLSIDVVEATTNGQTDSAVRAVSLLFMGDGGTIDGVSVSEGTGFKFCPTEGQDTIDSISYTIPTSGDQRIIISYVR